MARKDEERRLDDAFESRKRKKAEEDAKKNGKEGEDDDTKTGGQKGDDGGAASKKVDKNEQEREKRAEFIKATNTALDKILSNTIRKKKKITMPAKLSRTSLPLSDELRMKSALSAKPTASTGKSGGKSSKADGSSGTGEGNIGKSYKGATSKISKVPVTLKDCLYFLEHEKNSRKSELILKWYSRLAAPAEQPKPVAGSS